MSGIARDRFQSEDSYNVMLIAVDSTSRLNSIRTLPKTRAFMSNELEAVEMLGFTRVGTNTLPNVFALLTGLDSKQLRGKPFFDGYPFIWKNFSKLGYWTLFGEESPAFTNAFIYDQSGFQTTPTDFYFRPLTLAVEKEPAISKLACIGSKFESEFIAQWATDFAELSRTNQRPFFSFTMFGRLSHQIKSNQIKSRNLLNRRQTKTEIIVHNKQSKKLSSDQRSWEKPGLCNNPQPLMRLVTGRL